MNEVSPPDVDESKQDPMMSSAKNHDPDAKQKRAAQNEKDRALVEAAQGGDRRAFGQLVETYQRRVYAIAYGILRNRDDAWDAAQEAFVKAYKNLDRFEGTAAFYTWLYRITYNLSIDVLRERNRRDATPLDDNRKLEDALENQGRRPEGDPNEHADRKELTSILHRAMNQLSDKHRAIIVLREVEGLSYEEIADVLGISKGTVMSRLFHARKNLQKLLSPYISEGDATPGDLTLMARATA